MPKLKFTDIVSVAREARVTEGLVPFGPSYRTSMIDDKPIDPEGEIECVAVFGSCGALRYFDNLMREQHGFQFKWAKDIAGTYLRIATERVEF